ncbi:MAG TPA: nucleoside permease [Cyclobacteriaceae bacterium]|nr:nucleoside permease [Cyclobacteriaceae bacterium]HMV09797.1 nucleoside permease [Cyclobacteriaceae bacterium]HMV89725.1 nucleoside permease [Cyclobacteriaceae bacterium]HMX00493.1 nucleoside permease [Cyclobacteriaceae bacterium]HMX50423.1 nucleoside permease [Cyclobacteriaceae bacterium]
MSTTNNPGLFIRLSVMMFLQFFIWGAWFVTMGTYLSRTIGASDVQNGMAYGTQSLGAIIAPFVIGLIADRFFSAQKILGVIHLVGAGLLYWVARQTDFAGFYPLILSYMILYMPTLALVNTVAFRQLTDPEKQFSLLRVWGTVGWIVAGLTIGRFAWESSNSLANTFMMAAAASAILGLFSFTLPSTPPVSSNKKITFADIVGWDALKLLKDRSFLVFFISSMLICIPLAFYYQEANKFLNEVGLSNAASKMTIGQISETAFMLAIPLFFRRFGIKTMLLIGMGAWVARYLFFSFGNADDLVTFLYLGIALHGICYDFFFVTGQIYTEKRAGQGAKSAAQGMITLATYGAGMFIGFWVAGQITEYYKTAEGHNWPQIWLVPAGFAFLVMIIFGVFFKDSVRVDKK